MVSQIQKFMWFFGYSAILFSHSLGYFPMDSQILVPGFPKCLTSWQQIGNAYAIAHRFCLRSSTGFADAHIFSYAELTLAYTHHSFAYTTPLQGAPCLTISHKRLERGSNISAVLDSAGPEALNLPAVIRGPPIQTSMPWPVESSQGLSIIQHW